MDNRTDPRLGYQSQFNADSNIFPNRWARDPNCPPGGCPPENLPGNNVDIDNDQPDQNPFIALSDQYPNMPSDPIDIPNTREYYQP